MRLRRLFPLPAARGGRLPARPGSELGDAGGGSATDQHPWEPFGKDGATHLGDAPPRREIGPFRHPVAGPAPGKRHLREPGGPLAVGGPTVHPVRRAGNGARRVLRSTRHRQHVRSMVPRAGAATADSAGTTKPARSRPVAPGRTFPSGDGTPGAGERGRAVLGAGSRWSTRRVGPSRPALAASAGLWGRTHCGLTEHGIWRRARGPGAAPTVRSGSEALRYAFASVSRIPPRNRRPLPDGARLRGTMTASWWTCPQHCRATVRRQPGRSHRRPPQRHPASRARPHREPRLPAAHPVMVRDPTVRCAGHRSVRAGQAPRTRPSSRYPAPAALLIAGATDVRAPDPSS